MDVTIREAMDTAEAWLAAHEAGGRLGAFLRDPL
jgi:hypothetical protein